MSAEPRSLREELEAAAAGEDEPVVEVTDEAPIEATDEPEKPVEAGRERDESGRFVAKEEPKEEAEKPEAPVEAKPEDEAPESGDTDKPAPAPPNGWTAEAKGKWADLDPDIQAAVAKREQDIAKFVSKSDDERNFGREMQRVVSPYMAQIQAEGGTPTAAVQSLLNTAYLLRSGSPEQKRALLLQTAQQFGVDLGQPEQQQGDIPPYVQQLSQRFDQFEEALTQQQKAVQTQAQRDVDSEIEAFANDPAHIYFHEVTETMAALLSAGVAKNLQDAYDRSCQASPEIRATLAAQERAAEVQKRKQAEAERARQAKRKDVSLTGGPGSSSGQAPPESRSLREELEANLVASGGHV